MFFYFTIKHLFLRTYTKLLDLPKKYKGKIAQTAKLKNKKYAVEISVLKTDKSTNSNTGLYINTDVFDVSNNIKKRMISIEYYYNWILNRYQKTKSFVGTSYIIKWYNPLSWYRWYILNMLRLCISECIKSVEFQMAFDHNIKTFEDYFNVTVDRKIDTKYIKANKNKMAKTKEKQAE
jgi:hypothetical protein